MNVSGEIRFWNHGQPSYDGLHLLFSNAGTGKVFCRIGGAEDVEIQFSVRMGAFFQVCDWLRGNVPELAIEWKMLEDRLIAAFPLDVHIGATLSAENKAEEEIPDGEDLGPLA